MLATTCSRGRRAATKRESPAVAGSGAPAGAVPEIGKPIGGTQVTSYSDRKSKSDDGGEEALEKGKEVSSNVTWRDMIKRMAIQEISGSMKCLDPVRRRNASLKQK